MKNFLIFSLLAALCTQHITAMKRTRPIFTDTATESVKKKSNEEPQELLPELVTIIFENFPNTIAANNSLETIHNQIMSTSLVNKQLYKLIHSPRISLAIARKLSRGIQVQNLGWKINTPGIRNYANKSNTLYYLFTEKKKTTNKKIKQLVEEGADVNYMPSFHLQTMIYNARHNREHVKTLLELGADINVECCETKSSSYPRTILLLMIHEKPRWGKNLEEYYLTIQLLLSYNPFDKCLNYVMHTQDSRLLALVLQNNVPIAQLNMALSHAIEMQYIHAIQPLLNAGADAKRGFQKAFQLQHCFKKTFFPFKNEQDKEQFLEIVKILCQANTIDFEKCKNNFMQ